MLHQQKMIQGPSLTNRIFLDYSNFLNSTFRLSKMQILLDSI